jgi:hypothetical protein
MDEEACERFFSLDKAGRRKESKLAFRQFADSFSSAEQRDRWAREFLEKQEFFNRFDQFGIRVRQELFDEILWPFLRPGVEQHEPPCLYWLAGLQQNLLVPSYRDYPADLSPICLLREALEVEPTSLPIRRALLAKLIDLFHYADHEWPSGILNGMDGANIDVLSEYERLIELARSLDLGGSYADTLNDFAIHVQLYRQRSRAATKPR